MTAEREELVVSISPSNGAYLIHSSGVAWEDLTPIEQFDAASSVRTAKRLALQFAREGGYVGPFRWTRSPSGGWRLSAMYDEYAVRLEVARSHALAYGYEWDDDDEDESLSRAHERRRARPPDEVES